MLSVQNLTILKPGKYKVINTLPVPDRPELILLQRLHKNPNKQNFCLIDASYEVISKTPLADLLRQAKLCPGDIVSNKIQKQANLLRSQPSIIRTINVFEGRINTRKFYVVLAYLPLANDYVVWEQ